VKKWTAGVDLFKKKYALLPINEDHHWYLVLITNLNSCIPKGHQSNQNRNNINTSEEPTEFKKSTIYVLDSLHGKHTKCIKNIIKYLRMEAKHKRDVDLESFINPVTEYPLVPRQKNYYDCGIYILHFAELFTLNPQKFIEALNVSIYK
ncbi:hypothetical protein BJ944DRAFT_163374, partial [Cunninghamella echinulata]